MAKSKTSSGLTRAQVLAYSGAAFSTAIIAQPMSLYLPQIYAKELGVSLAQLGLVLLLTQILDAVNQQVCGFLSDRTRTRFGARKPWVMFGALLTVAGSFMLMRPPEGVGLAWFVVWKLLYDFGYTSKFIAYNAWGAELSGDYKERSRIVGTSGFLGQAGNVVNDLLPIAVFYMGLTSSEAYSMQVMGYYALVGMFAIPLLHAVAVTFVPQGAPMPQERPNLLGMWTSVKANKPFWRYLASFMMSGLGIGALSLNFTFYDGYLNMGRWFPYLMTIFAITTVVSIPAWVWIANKIGKHKAYAAAMLIGGGAPVAWVFLDPDTASQQLKLTFGAVVVILIGIGVACNFVTSSSILADVVDYGTLKTKVRRTASYFAFYLLVNKVAIAIGSGLAFIAVAAFGYDPKLGINNSDHAKFGVLLVVAVVPALLKAPAALIMWFYPLTAKRHGIIQRRLASRTARADRAAQAMADANGLNAPSLETPIVTPPPSRA